MAQEKRIVHYSSSQKILLVGEGDFSFAACLATAFDSAANIVATSLNSRGYLRGSFSSESDKSQILAHKNLVKGYFMSAHQMLCSRGQIHVTHKTKFPFTEWEIVNLAKVAGLYLVEEETFYPWQYPGYVNKRGAGNCDESFRLGMSSTFKFAKY
ncbi:uncharacterized protein At4g26485 [Rosa chinensis]|uniref:uncharacterized protein At4g26485 n=1 Tax=Rosa chinensis TaxID=74649 RepID=UPI000D08BD71|nr:uncharacterized protein At4g26485 [Rosa chinensis]